MMDVHFGYSFHPIGQGLFSTGDLQGNVAAQQFAWVFDCGTASPLRYLQKQIDVFTGRLASKPIGLFCLSHFDKDHVNGARELLTSHRVDTLVMPYFPLVERMVIAVAEPDLSEDYLSFLIDPAGYMYAAAGDNLGNIVFITGGGSTPEDPAAPARPDYPDDGNWDLHFPDTEAPDSPAPEDLHGVSDPGSWRAVRVFTHARPFTVGGVWEFMFYNEHIPDKKAEALREDVAKLIRTFRRQDGSFEGNKLIAELKRLYDREFGSSGLARNRISLIVYSGPIHRNDLTGFYLSGALTARGLESFPWPHPYYFLPVKAMPCRVSIGYFGDFPLTSPTRLDNVRNHFGKRRWGWLEVVQVPHHGSRHSWYTGASAEFEHCVSLISAARLSRKANVLFFDRKPAAEKPWTEKLWIYDLRTNKHFTLKENPLKRSDLDDFVSCYNPKNRHERKESERFKSFTYEDLLKRDKLNLDIFWLKDESLEDSANLPEPDIIAAEIVEDLQAALAQFAEIASDLKK